MQKKLSKTSPAKNGEVRWVKAGTRRGHSVYVVINDYAEFQITGKRGCGKWHIRIVNNNIAYEATESTLEKAKNKAEKAIENLREGRHAWSQ